VHGLVIYPGIHLITEENTGKHLPGWEKNCQTHFIDVTDEPAATIFMVYVVEEVTPLGFRGPADGGSKLYSNRHGV
jgi:hypothetical protein